MKIFMIGPGGVGKSTIGKKLSEKLNIPLIDLDIKFLEKYGDINKLINIKGKIKYSKLNSGLFYKLLKDAPKNYVFILSSGFLVYKDKKMVNKNLETLKTGISVLIYPSKSFEESREIVVKRQLSRRLGYKKEHEAQKFTERFLSYQEFADIIIYSQNSPDKITELLIEKINLMKKNEN